MTLTAQYKAWLKNKPIDPEISVWDFLAELDAKSPWIDATVLPPILLKCNYSADLILDTGGTEDELGDYNFEKGQYENVYGDKIEPIRYFIVPNK